jgi:hypothetical protein
MSRVDALIQLGLSGQDFGPCYTDEWTHAEFAAGWRGTVPCPTETEVIAAAALYRYVPAEVTMRQGREALIRRDHFAAVNAAIAGMPGVDGDIARNEWNTSQVIQRERPLTIAMAQLIGLEIPEDLDEWFIYASTL